MRHRGEGKGDGEYRRRSNQAGVAFEAAFERCTAPEVKAFEIAVLQRTEEWVDQQ